MARRGLERWRSLSQRLLYGARLHVLEGGGWLRSANRPTAEKVSVGLLEHTPSGGSPKRGVTNGYSHPGVPPTGNDQEDLCAKLRHEHRDLHRQHFAGGGAICDDGTRGGSATVRSPPYICTLKGETAAFGQCPGFGFCASQVGGRFGFLVS